MPSDSSWIQNLLFVISFAAVWQNDKLDCILGVVKKSYVLSCSYRLLVMV